MRLLVSSLAALAAICLSIPVATYAADHRDAPIVSGAPEGDITDVYAFIDPNDKQRVILMMGVNGFANASVQSTYKFSTQFLYQFKIDRDEDFREDLIVQVLFEGAGRAQRYRVLVGAAEPGLVGTLNRLVTSEPSVQGPIDQVNGDPTAVLAWAGLRDDPFVADIGQLNRILGGTQDVFRAFTSPVAAVGALRGRGMRSDSTTGFDGFGGFNANFIMVSLPLGYVPPQRSSRINIWGTVSAPIGGGEYIQFERMGQPLFNTVFVPSALKDAFNASAPADDVARYSNLVPDALTTTDNDGAGNTIAGRATVLTALGLTDGKNGAPLLLPSSFANTNRDLLRAALLPDALRLDVNLASSELAVGQFGLLNGRRPGDDVVDIALLVLRQLADVNFPSALGIPGSGRTRAGALNFPDDRRVFAVLQGSDFIKPDARLSNLAEAGNDRAFRSPYAFPFLGTPHPIPGEPDATGFPANPQRIGKER
jgi:hypothetical protein